MVELFKTIDDENDESSKKLQSSIFYTVDLK